MNKRQIKKQITKYNREVQIIFFDTIKAAISVFSNLAQSLKKAATATNKFGQALENVEEIAGE